MLKPFIRCKSTSGAGFTWDPPDTVLAGICTPQSTASGRDEAGSLTMPSCIPGSSPAAPQPSHRHGGPGLPLSAGRPAMESLIVVTECEATASEEEMSVAAVEESREPRAKLNLSGRKLSLQERSHPVRSPGSGDSERFIYPSLPYSPVTSPHSSPRLPRRPTVESNRVSITGLQVRPGSCLTALLLARCFGMEPHGWWEGGRSWSIPSPWDSPTYGGRASPRVNAAVGVRFLYFPNATSSGKCVL